jgi:hypothetical protein
MGGPDMVDARILAIYWDLDLPVFGWVLGLGFSVFAFGSAREKKRFAFQRTELGGPLI